MRSLHHFPIRLGFPLIACAVALTFFRAGAARAWDVEIDSQTIGQGYAIIGGDGGIITRRRIDQYLGLHVWNLGKTDAYGVPLPKNQFYFTSSLRMEFDLGNYPNNQIGSLNVGPELGTNTFELLYAYFGAKDFLGFIDAKLGRQLEYNLFEYAAYDGLSVDIKTPWFVSVHALGGLLVNGFLPIDSGGSGLYRPDGTALGNLSVHDQDAKPIVGVGLRAFGFRDSDASLDYRRIYSPGTGNSLCPAGGPGSGADIATLEACTHSGNGTSEEKIGGSIRYRLLGGVVIPWAGVRYDLVSGVFDLIEAGVRVTINPQHSLQLEYLYSFPTFDGDSIFNLFARSQFNDVRLGYDLRLGRLRGFARAFVRLFQDIIEPDRLGQPTSTAPAGSVDYGGDVGARYDLKNGYIRGDIYAELGYGGIKVGTDASSRFKVYKDIFSLEGRLTFVHFEDDLRTINHADSFGIQLGARISFWQGMLLHIIAEDNISHFYASQFRLYAVLDIAALIGKGGFSAPGSRGMGPGMGQFGSPYGTGRGF